ncbi:MAG: sensor domain-containing diguanylate cyclase, partial [Nitrospirota bacterium]|nr:sensor domain-containing diguanylate cyclase [Nitrospirota bacterium]
VFDKPATQPCGEQILIPRQPATLREVMGRWCCATQTDAPLTLENLVQSLCSSVDIELAAILNREADGGYAVAHQQSSKEVMEKIAGLAANDPVIPVLQSGRAYIHSASPEVPGGAAGTAVLKACSFFPILIRGHLESILMVGSRPLQESDAQTLVVLCRLVSLTIENSRLHSDLLRKFSRISEIAEMAQEITSVQGQDSLLQRILERSAKLLMAEQGSLMLIDRDADALFVEVTTGTHPETPGKLRIPLGRGIAGKVAEQGEAILVKDVENDPRTRQKKRSHYKTASFVSVPLKVGDRTIGVLNLSDKTSGEVFDREDLHLIQSLATHAAVVLERNALEHQTERLRKLTITDPLTGLQNRRHLQDRLEEEMARSQRHGRSLSLLMLDVDRFKLLNDTFGHQAGDDALRLIAQLLLKTVRHMDILARYAGDEFLVILPETDTALARRIAERIRQDIAALRLPRRGRTNAAAADITVSIGIASYPDHGEEVEQLLERSDQALYRAKARGRNRTEVYA